MILADIITKINQALNYPSLTYVDVSLYLDQAIAELNTSLHIQLPPVSKMLHFADVVERFKDITVILNEEPLESTTLIPHYVDEESLPEDKPYFYFNLRLKKYGILKNDVYFYTNKIYGLYASAGETKMYLSMWVSETMQMWVNAPEADLMQTDIGEYLPQDWIILYLIPYVCFKYAVRDGDTGALYSEEFTQGYQQLNNAYDVPSTVYLPNVVHIPAYRQDVKDNINNLTIKVKTKAITDNMLHNRDMKNPRPGFFSFGFGNGGDFF